MANVPKLFDICCENPRKLRALEMQYQLRMTEDDFAFYENPKRSGTATCMNVVESLTTSDVEFKRKNALQLCKPCKIVPQHPILHLMKLILLHHIPIFLIVMPQVTIFHRLLPRKTYRFITLYGQLKTDFLAQIWQWRVIDTRSQIGLALQ